MNNMPHYGDYTQVYGGNLIPQEAFGQMVARAQDALAAMKRQYRVTGTQQQEIMALCAMAEALYGAKDITSATMGSVSVHYGNRPTQLKALYQAARRYLDTYRGVGI